jgi:hypothetical protein
VYLLMSNVLSISSICVSLLNVTSSMKGAMPNLGIRLETEKVKVVKEKTSLRGPNLAHGVAVNDFTGESLLGHVGDQDVLPVRSGSEIFAIGAHCSHYHGPLAEGACSRG